MKATRFNKRTTYNQKGFTIVETIVTIVVVSLFAGFFFQMFIVTEGQRIAMQKREVATHIAVSDLDKITAASQFNAVGGFGYDVAGKKTYFACGTNGDTSADTNDLTVDPNATGADLVKAGIVGGEDLTPLGQGATQTLRVTYPRGCMTGTAPNIYTPPARVQATITYGTNPVETVIHVEYVN